MFYVLIKIQHGKYHKNWCSLLFSSPDCILVSCELLSSLHICHLLINFYILIFTFETTSQISTKVGLNHTYIFAKLGNMQIRLILIISKNHLNIFFSETSGTKVKMTLHYKVVYKAFSLWG